MKSILRDKILLVDDEPMVLEGMRTLLQGSLDVSTAPDAGTGLRILRSNGPYAVLISDYRMPDMNGIEFLSRTREISPLTIRIMLTGYAEINTAIAAVNTGEVFRFHTKPCSPSLLRKTITEALEKFHFIQTGHVYRINTLPKDENSEVLREFDFDLQAWKLLTSKEMRIADLIRKNLSSKEIAATLYISVRTVETHRENIRKKLGLANKKINLQNYLLSIPLYFSNS